MIVILFLNSYSKGLMFIFQELCKRGPKSRYLHCVYVSAKSHQNK